jgi:hypothetical protein
MGSRSAGEPAERSAEQPAAPLVELRMTEACGLRYQDPRSFVAFPDAGNVLRTLGMYEEDESDRVKEVEDSFCLSLEEEYSKVDGGRVTNEAYDLVRLCSTKADFAGGGSSEVPAGRLPRVERGVSCLVGG